MVSKRGAFTSQVWTPVGDLEPRSSGLDNPSLSTTVPAAASDDRQPVVPLVVGQGVDGSSRQRNELSQL